MKTIQTLLLATLPLLGLLSCREADSKDQTEEKVEDKLLVEVSRQQFEANGMELVPIENKSFPRHIRVSGTLDVPPENRVVITAVYGGYVKNTRLLVGDKVSRGQAVITLENPEYLVLQQQFLEVQEQLPYLKAEFERQEILFSEKISSEKIYLKAKSEFKTARARENSLREQLKLLGVSLADLANGKLTSQISLHTPIKGKVSRINVQKGTYVSPATEIMEIVNQDHLHLELSVFEKDASDLAIGQEITFGLPEVSDKKFKGSVYLIGSSIDENRTVKVHGHLDEEPESSLLVGMYVEADIQVTLKGVDASRYPLYPAVPETAIRYDQDRPYLLLLESQTASSYYFRKKLVETGSSFQGYTKLSASDGLSPGDQILNPGKLSL